MTSNCCKNVGACLLMALTLAGCGGSDDAENEASGNHDARASGTGGTGGGSGQTTGGDAGQAGAPGSPDQPTSPDEPDDPTTGSSPEVEACSALSVEFAEPGGDEHVQWKVGDEEHEALPPAGGAYFFNGFLNMVTYAGNLSGSVAVGVWGSHESVPAGTYRCLTGESTAAVTVNGLGIANATALGADCAVTYEEDVVDGGRLKGSFWAYFPASDWPLVSEGGCVHGRFDVTDAPD